jgi:hypothetical protein
MMMKLTSVCVMCLGLAACSTDDGDSAGSGEDVLPMRGEMATDPTIVSATANRPSGSSYAWLRVAASDPKGTSNLATCAFIIDGVTHQGYFSDGYEQCTADLDEPWPTGTVNTVKVIVSNATGGFTSASISLMMDGGSGRAR